MDFWGDRRGQPVQIGFILLFGILVLAFASYQGYVVPNQNAKVEFNHFQSVGDEFTEFHSTLVNSVERDSERSSTFVLGTRYPSRLIALNPPPVAGSLQTTGAGEVSIEENGTDRTESACASENATTRSLVYRPQYNEHRNAEAIAFENSFVAKEYRGATVFGEQRFVQPRSDGPDDINLVLLNGSVSRDGSDAVSVVVEGSDRREILVQDPNVTVPSRYNATAWEDRILDEVDGAEVTVPEPGLVSIDFTGEYQLSCAVVGLDGDPAFGPGISGAGEGDEINPAAPGNIRLEEEFRDGNSLVRLRFNNSAGTNNITKARINYYQSEEGGGNQPDAANISLTGGPTSATLEFRADFEPLSPEIQLKGETSTDVTLDFFQQGGKDNPNLDSNSWFILTLELATGETATYFIAVPQ